MRFNILMLTIYLPGNQQQSGGAANPFTGGSAGGGGGGGGGGGYNYSMQSTGVPYDSGEKLLI